MLVMLASSGFIGQLRQMSPSSKKCADLENVSRHFLG